MKHIVKDIDSQLLKVGDFVQKVEWGDKAIHRRVEAIGESECTGGYIKVSGSIAWESSKRYRKVLR